MASGVPGNSWWNPIRPNRAPLKRREILIFFVTLVGLISLSFLLSRAWVFEYAGIRSHEILQRAIAAQPAKYTRIIFITSEDYRREFHQCLEPTRLDKMIDRILEFKPAVVVIDLDTSAERFRALKPRPGSPIVWARDADEELKAGKLELNLLPIHGEMDSTNVLWGLALFPRSADWTVRAYSRSLPVGTVRKPSLHWEAVNRFCESQPAGFGSCDKVKELAAKPEVNEEELTIPVLHARYAFESWELGDILGESSGKPLRAAADSDLAKKVVLLGGSYSAQDKHQTPFGALDGIEVVGSAIEAELNPQGQSEISVRTEIMFKVILALLIGVVHHFLKPFYALLFTMGLLSFVVFFGSLMVAFFAGYRANFVPFLVGIWIEQLYTSAEKGQEGVHGSAE